MRRWWGALVAFVAIAACQDDPVPKLKQASADVPPSATSDAGFALREGGIAWDGTAPPPPPQRPNTCQRPGVMRPFSTLTELHTFISRRWVLCSSKGIGDSARDPDQEGLEIHVDGTFEILRKDASGKLVPSTSIHGHGTAEFLPVVLHRDEIIFHYPDAIDSGPWITVVTDSPRALVMTSSIAGGAQYVPETTTDWPDLGIVQPPQGSPKPAPAACTSPRGAGRALSPADFAADVAADWILCSGTPFGQRTDAAGLRLEAGGAWGTLVWDASGQLALANDIGNGGAWHWSGSLFLVDGISYTTWDLVHYDNPRRLSMLFGGQERAHFIRREDAGLAPPTDAGPD